MVHQIQTSRALVTDREDTEPAAIVEVSNDRVGLVSLKGRELTVTVAEPDQLHDTLARADLTRRDGLPVALVSTRYRLLAVAFGPPEAPSQFAVSGVLGIDTVPPVVPATEEDDPSWACFDLIMRPAEPIIHLPDPEDRVDYTAGEPCPVCNSDRVVEIVYGMPGSELVEASRRGEVALGGCCIGGDDPTHRCLDCGTDLAVFTGRASDR